MAKTLDQMFKEGLSNDDVLKEYAKIRKKYEDEAAKKKVQDTSEQKVLDAFIEYVKTLDVSDKTASFYTRQMKELLTDLRTNKLLKPMSYEDIQRLDDMIKNWF